MHLTLHIWRQKNADDQGRFAGGHIAYGVCDWSMIEEFPNGIYHYYATDSYPYFQRCVKGVL